MADSSAGSGDAAVRATDAAAAALGSGEAGTNPAGACTSCKVISAVVPAAAITYLLRVGYMNPQGLAGRRLVYHRFSIGVCSLALAMMSVSSVFEVGIFDKEQKISIDNLTDLDLQKKWFEKDLNKISQKSNQLWAFVRDGFRDEK